MMLHALSQGIDEADRTENKERCVRLTTVRCEQTQPIWSKWGMTRERAFQTARGMFDPAYRTTESVCACGKAAGERCGDGGEHVISVDVLSGVQAH